MDSRVLLIFFCVEVAVSAWSIPYHHMRRPLRVTRFAPPPPHYRIPVRPTPQSEEPKWERPKRQHDYNDDHHTKYDDHGPKYDDHSNSGVTGPVHTFVKTDKNANYKWGVRHHVGNKYAS